MLGYSEHNYEYLTLAANLFPFNRVTGTGPAYFAWQAQDFTPRGLDYIVRAIARDPYVVDLRLAEVRMNLELKNQDAANLAYYNLIQHHPNLPLVRRALAADAEQRSRNGGCSAAPSGCLIEKERSPLGEIQSEHHTGDYQ